MRVNRLLIIPLCSLIILIFIVYNIDVKLTQADKSINGYNIKSKIQTSEMNEEYVLKTNIIYYVLNDEYFKNYDVNNPKSSQLIREFICYDGIQNGIYADSRIVSLDKVDNIEEFRKKVLSENPNALKLPPNAIVSNTVINKWKSQNYDDSSSYSDKSPKGLAFSKIQ